MTRLYYVQKYVINTLFYVNNNTTYYVKLYIYDIYIYKCHIRRVHAYI